MVMFMIKGELYKLLRSKSVKVLFILLFILNSLQIIYVNYQNIYGDINTGKRRILKIIEGPISQQKYDGRARFEKDFLINVKADLDSFNDLSFLYSYLEGKYVFIIYNTRKSVGNNYEISSLNELKIDRSLKYFRRIRGLNDIHGNVLKKLYRIRGHKELSKIINSKIEVHLKGGNYIKAIFILLKEKE